MLLLVSPLVRPLTDYFRLADFPNDRIVQELDSTLLLRGDFRCLISRPYRQGLVNSRPLTDNVGEQPIMIFSHFPQAKPATTAFNPPVTVTSDVVRNYRRFPTLHPNEEVGADPVGRNLIPPVVSYPGHFNAILCRITLAAYPIN